MDKHQFETRMDHVVWTLYALSWIFLVVFVVGALIWLMVLFWAGSARIATVVTVACAIIVSLGIGLDQRRWRRRTPYNVVAEAERVLARARKR